MVSFLERYRGPRDAIEDVLDGKKSATQAVQYLSGYSHFLPYSSADMKMHALGLVEEVMSWPAFVMPDMTQLAHVIKKTLTGKVNAAATVKDWYTFKPWAQLGLVVAQRQRNQDTVFGRTVFAGSVMPAGMAKQLLNTCEARSDSAMRVDELDQHLDVRSEYNWMFDISNDVDLEQTPVVVTALRTNEITNETALHVIPLRPGTCVVNDEGLVIYVYDKPMGASGPQNVFFERNANGFMTTRVVQGWIDGFQLRAGCESHAQLFVERGLTTPWDQSTRRSLFTRQSLAQHNR